jgi:GTP cyclohydrolase I
MTDSLTLPNIDTDRIARAVTEILLAIGEDPTREGLERTPARVAAMYTEIFGGLQRDPADVLSVGFEEHHEEMVILKDIPFYSMCEHHLLPFHGSAAIGYIPSGRVVGISKIARLVEIYARRPQLQERLTSQIADALMEHLHPHGVGVVIRAEHLCMTMRGVRKPGSQVVTSANRGIFRSRHETRAEFMALIGHAGHE